MFDKNYYCLVAGLREYSLDADTKGFNARAIIEEILEGVSARDARCVRLLYGYYDCENLVNFRKGRTAHNPLGNLSREEIEEQTKNPDRLPARMATVVRSYSAIVDEDADNEDGIDTTDRSRTLCSRPITTNALTPKAASCASGRTSTAICATLPLLSWHAPRDVRPSSLS